MRAPTTDTYRHYRGTADELVRRGVLEQYMLERLAPEKRQASGHDEFGDHWTCRRLADGRLHLARRPGSCDRRTDAAIAAGARDTVAALLAALAR